MARNLHHLSSMVFLQNR